MKKVLKRVLSVLLCLSVFCFPMSFTYAASGDLLPANVVTWDDVSADGKALAEAYYNLIQSGTNLEFKRMFKSATDIPLTYFKLLSDGSWVLSPVDDIYYYFKDGEFYVHEEGHGGGGGTRPGEEDSGHGGGGGDRPATSSDIYIPVDTFNEFLDKTNTQLSPKNASGKMSFWTDANWHNKYDSMVSSKAGGYGEWGFYNESGGFSAVGGGNEIYFIPFYYDGEKTMYSKYQFHYTVEVIENWATDRDEIESYSYNLKGVVWDYFESTQDESFESATYNSSSCGNFRFAPYYVDSGGYPTSCQITFYKTLSDYVNYNNSSFRGEFKPASYQFLIFYDPETRISYNGETLCNDFQVASQNPDPNKDFGYVASATPIEFTYKIDTQKIPNNYYITVGGDTVYDYHITNPETGQSDTINNYVTNNYTYITNPDSGDDSGGGSGSGAVGGNVNVSGNIGVNGNVGVDVTVSVPDININVNQSSGAGGSSGGSGGGTVINPDDVLDGSSVDLDKYYDDAITQASGVRSFLERFFDFLPPEIVALLALLIAVAIICRLFGR